MKSILLLLALLLLPRPLRAEEGSLAFRDAFRSYETMRLLEEKSRINLERTDLEEGARLELIQTTAAKLTEARIDYQAFLQNPKELSDWEQSVLRKAGALKPGKTVDKTALNFLSRYYSKTARQWSPVEWQSAGEWFGVATQDSFLKTVFAMEETPKQQAVPEKSEASLVWIRDPFARFLPKAEAQLQKTQEDAAKAQLRNQGYKLEDMEIETFARLDDQAEALHEALTKRLENGPIVVLSSGHGSAVLLHAFDLNPALLGNDKIAGWLNVNGKLFGDSLPMARNPASATKADRQLVDARHELVLLREERLTRQTPLSAKFPVLNLVTLSGANRPGANLRDSLLPEGKTLFQQSGDGFGAIQTALPSLLLRKPAGAI